jgi:hypothetical protein
MPLSLNEIKKRAVAFSKEWEHESSEDAEAKSFWDGFFNVFGIPRRRVAMFEQQVRKLDNRQGYIDLLWKGKLLIEHKSRGKDLERAYKQAKDYFPGLKDEELPRYILICDFHNFRLYDLDENKDYSFTLNKLVDNVRLFDFISGHIHHRIREQDPVNIEAAEMMGKLHDKLKEAGYTGHQLELYLVRLVFCLFADDTNIFEQGIFYDLLDQRTKEDGSDLAGWLASLFNVLDTPEGKRYKNLDEDLAAFPYVNGKLFEEQVRPASFDSEMRLMLIKSCALDWSAISPAIFGSLFQSVMDKDERRNLGAHYTSEVNILKVIKPLFLDELWTEFNKIKLSGTQPQLEQFHEKISNLRFFDPACGCGNFLIIAYRELRILEIEVIKQLLFKYYKIRPEVAKDSGINIKLLVKCDVDQFYGIEYKEFPAQIAQVAMWLIDHQMNREVSLAFGLYFARLPLEKSPTIFHGNALRIDWQSLLPAGKLYNYILGNPPFYGKHLQTPEQKEDMELVFDGVKSSGVLDYVTAWYILAAKYMHEHNTENVKVKTAFVSTNSISQGEQVGILWNELFNTYKTKIHFAHRTFKWENEAGGNAGVYVVIIGFANFDIAVKKLYLYSDIQGLPEETTVKNINPYLIEGRDTVITSRTRPICSVPSMLYGNKIVDGGHYLFSDSEMLDFLDNEPNAKKYFKPILSGDEFINGRNRWILYLKGISPNELKSMPSVVDRVNKVKEFREASPKKQTKEAAQTPTLFAEQRQPVNDFLLIPRTTSENRLYIPFGFFNPSYIVNDSCTALPNATLFHFGILSSTMHMSWVRQTCGRLESRYRYSNSLVYNNFPWPGNPNERRKKAVEDAAQDVLDARAKFPDASLADLYDPNTMPPVLVKAHQKLDRAVDLCYRPQPFPDETRRIEYLFELYDKYTAGLFKEEKKGKKKK